jgi:ATP-dependent Clp protease ATP-binding subunit ClpA
MFERYTERARRVIFFSRYEASQFGSTIIETEHLLLGLIREDKNLTNRFLRQSVAIPSIREEIEGRCTIRDKVSTSVDLPLSDEYKRILAYAEEEAEALQHRHLGTEHMLLGILREENCLAAQVLTGRGLSLDSVREELSKNVTNTASARTSLPRYPRYPKGSLPFGAVVPDETTASRIAEAIWEAKYSKDSRNPIKSTTVELNHDVWIVTGSLTEDEQQSVLVAFIQRSDGKVLRIHRETPKP